MRQVMPHRNNIAVRRTKCKIFFANRRRGRRKIARCAPVYDVPDV